MLDQLAQLLVMDMLLPTQLLQQQKAGKQKSHQLQHQQPAFVAAAVADVCLAAASLSGAALLTWWAVAFHPSYDQLWMVPVGLVLACTPVVVGAALHFSPHRPDADDLPPLSAVVVDK